MRGTGERELERIEDLLISQEDKDLKKQGLIFCRLAMWTLS